MYACPVAPGDCDGVRGDTTRYIDDEPYADNNATSLGNNDRTLLQRFVEGRLFDQARELLSFCLEGQCQSTDVHQH